MNSAVSSFTLGAIVTALGASRAEAQAFSAQYLPLRDTQTVSQKYEAYSEPVFHESSLPLLVLSRPLGLSPNFNPALPENVPVYEGDPAQNTVKIGEIQAAFIAALKSDPKLNQLSALGADLLACASAFGNPAVLAGKSATEKLLPPLQKYPLPLSDENITLLWNILSSNPFLAAVWNSEVVAPSDYFATQLKPIVASSPLKVPHLSNTVPQGDGFCELRDIQQAFARAARDVSAIALLPESLTNAETLEQRFAIFEAKSQKMLGLGETLVEHSRALGQAKREVVASAIALAVLASSPDCWGQKNISGKFFESAVELSTAIHRSQQTTDKPAVDRILEEWVQPRLYGALRDLTSSIRANASPEYTQALVEDGLKILNQSIALIQSPALPSDVAAFINSEKKRIEGADGDLAGLKKQDKFNILLNRVIEGSHTIIDSATLRLTLGKSGTLFALQTFSPEQLPDLYQAISGVSVTGRMLPVPALTRNIDRLLGLNELQALEGGQARKALIEALNIQVGNFHQLSTVGLDAILAGQYDTMSRLVEDFIITFGSPSNLDSSPSKHIYLNIKLIKDTAKWDAYIATLNTAGQKGYELCHDLEIGGAAAKGILKNLEGDKDTPYAALRERVLTPGARESELILSTGDFFQLLQRIQEDPDMGPALVYGYYDRLEENKQELSRRINESQGAGGVPRALIERQEVVNELFRKFEINQDSPDSKDYEQSAEYQALDPNK